MTADLKQLQQLRQLRDKIDAIDSDLLRLVSERAGLAEQIGKIKNGRAYRPEREAQVLARVREMNSGPLPDEHIVRLFTEIMSLCRSMEEPLTVAYLGPQGTFSEEAALKRFGSIVITLACSSIDEVFRKVEAGAARYGRRCPRYVRATRFPRIASCCLPPACAAWRRRLPGSR